MELVPDDLTEIQLVRNLSNGDIPAFNKLFKKYGNRLYGFALGYLKSEAESEELVQDVFMRIWENRASLREELSFKSYIFTIALNIIRKHFRTRAYWIEYFTASTTADFDIQTSNNIIFDSLQQYVKELSDRLPERRKIIFIKSRFEGKNNEEIALELRISKKTVENHITEALKFIKVQLLKEGVPLCILLFFSI